MTEIRTITEDWKENWREILSRQLNGRIVHWIDLHFKELEIEHAPPFEIMRIKESDIMESWLSVPSMKQLMLFQNELHINLGLINEHLKNQNDDK